MLVPVSQIEIRLLQPRMCVTMLPHDLTHVRHPNARGRTGLFLVLGGMRTGLDPLPSLLSRNFLGEGVSHDQGSSGLLRGR